MTDPGIVPDPGIVRQLKAIDADLSIAWVELPDATGRWGVFHSLQVDGRFEDTVAMIAREIQRDMALKGNIIGFHECAYLARETVKEQQLVCYVVDDDGSFRPLDGRIVEKVQRMDYYRKNLGLVGWKDMMRAKADVLEATRRREADDQWEQIKRDKVMKRMVSDILWGIRPIRSVEKRRMETDNERTGDQRNGGADNREGSGEAPERCGADGDSASPAGGGAAAGGGTAGL